MHDSIPKMFRVMEADPSDPLLPLVAPTATGLGVRVAPTPHPDVSTDAQGILSGNMEGGGMSVSPRLCDLPPWRVPKRLRHVHPGAAGTKNDHKVFRWGIGAFVRAQISPQLALTPDTDTHGIVHPAQAMQVQQFQQALADTQTCWIVDEVGP